MHWEDCCRSWNSNTLATWWEELTHWKRPWCWVRLKAGGDGDGRGWDGWMASLTQWTWVWVNSGSWWWTGMPGVLQSMGSQRVVYDWATELNCVFGWSISFVHLRNCSSSEVLFQLIRNTSLADTEECRFLPGKTGKTRKCVCVCVSVAEIPSLALLP